MESWGGKPLCLGVGNSGNALFLKRQRKFFVSLDKRSIMQRLNRTGSVLSHEKKDWIKKKNGPKCHSQISSDGGFKSAEISQPYINPDCSFKGSVF